jgi:uncharacterized protein (TIGR02598 family)
MRKEVQKRETGQRDVEIGSQRSQFQPSTFILSSGAFSLIEVTIALGIAAFCLIAMLGLLPSGMRNAATASEQTATIGILGDVLSDLKGTPVSSTNSPRFEISIPTAGNSTSQTLYFSENGTKEDTVSQARYSVVANLSAPTGSTVANTQVRIYWPAAASVANASGSIESVTVLDRFRNAP